MSGHLRTAAAIVLAISMATLASGGAAAFAFEDISGKWCATGGTEQFDRENLVVILKQNGERYVFPIVKYEPGAAFLRVVWKNGKGEEVHTDFAEFSADRRSMVQLSSDAGPRREFHRC